MLLKMIGYVLALLKSPVDKSTIELPSNFFKGNSASRPFLYVEGPELVVSGGSKKFLILISTISNQILTVVGLKAQYEKTTTIILPLFSRTQIISRLKSRSYSLFFTLLGGAPYFAFAKSFATDKRVFILFCFSLLFLVLLMSS